MLSIKCKKLPLIQESGNKQDVLIVYIDNINLTFVVFERCCWGLNLPSRYLISNCDKLKYFHTIINNPNNEQ